jgi:RimJ/RimL family protein N-acetyltransferase
MTSRLASPPPLRDGEVELQPLDSRVAALLVAASNDAEITRWTQVPAGMSVLDAGLVAAGWLDSRRAVRMQVCVPGHAPAGMVTVWINSDGEAEIGYWLLEPARGRGTAGRAVRLLCDWVFAFCDVDKIQLTMLAGNAASEHVASACGFRPAGSVEREVKSHTRTLSLWERSRASVTAL